MATATPTPRTSEQSRVGLPITDLTMLLVVLIWGANFTVVKIGLQEMPPIAFAALRFAAAGLILWLIMQWREGHVAISRGQLWKLTWIGIIGNTFYQIFFTYGLTITSAANGSLLIATVPAMVAIVGALLGIEKLRPTTISGVALAFMGVALVLLSRGLSFSAEQIRGDLAMLAAAVCWTIYTLGVRTLGAGLSPLRITTMTMVTGVPGLLLFSVPELRQLDWAALSAGAWASLLYASLLGLVVAYVLWNNSVRVAGSNRTAIYGCAIPLVAALVAWPALGETPTWLQGVGAVLIIGGVLLSRR